MKWLSVLGMAVIGIHVSAQWPTLPDPVETPPPASRHINLPGMINSPANYKGYLPRGDINYEIQNLGEQPATLWVVIVEEGGTRQFKHIALEAGATFDVLADSEFESAEVHILSLQPFRVTTESPVETVGPASRHIVVTPATKPLRDLRVMETQSGNTITVGIDRQGRCHFPVYGRAIGTLGDQGRVRLFHGFLLEPFTR